MRVSGLLVLVASAAAAAYVYTQSRDAEPTATAPRAQVDPIADDAEVGHDAATDAEPVARAPLGDELEVALAFGAATHYMLPISEDGGDLDLAPRVSRISGGTATYDPWLGRAARELAVQGAILGVNPPEAVLSFLLRSAGAPEGSVAQMLVEVRGDIPKAIDDAIASALASAPQGEGALVVGVGEAAMEEGDFERRLVVISARRSFSLEPTTRQLEPGETWIVAGRAPSGFRDAHASVLYPDGHIDVIEVEMDGQNFSVRIPAGSSRGTVWASIDGQGRRGPGKLLQLQAEVGREVPESIRVEVPTAEELPSDGDAEALALELLNRDREALGLAALILDDALSDIARAHSEEMRDMGYFAHQSPTTGLASDRLENAQYAALTHGENLALNDSIAEAQSSLMESVGHRRNIVSSEFSHVGIGVARSKAPSGGDSWHLTQVFATPVQELDPIQAAEDVVNSINRHREERGVDALVPRDELSELAAEGCELALSEELERVPSRIASKASRAVGGRASVSAHSFYDFASLELSQIGTDAEATEIGVALVRDPEDLRGRTLLVVIVGEPRN